MGGQTIYALTPAEELEELNRHLVGTIEVVARSGSGPGAGVEA